MICWLKNGRKIVNKNAIQVLNALNGKYSVHVLFNCFCYESACLGTQSVFLIGKPNPMHMYANIGLHAKHVLINCFHLIHTYIILADFT